MSTGACIVALGEKVAALYSSDDSLRHGIEAAARRSDEGDLHHIALECYPNK
jgi:leucyl aminopeptidase